MLTRDRIDRFYQDVKSLNLKFPVAIIAKKTGESKGNVSRYLNRKLDPSESFLNRFYESFKVVPHETPTHIDEEGEGHAGDVSASLESLIESNNKLAHAQDELVRILAKVIDGAFSRSSEELDPLRFASLDFLFEVAAGRKYNSVEEARRIWRNKVAAEGAIKKKKDIHDGS